MAFEREESKEGKKVKYLVPEKGHSMEIEREESEEIRWVGNVGIGWESFEGVGWDPR